MSDTIVCDFVFVPNGAPFPTDWVRRHPDYITLPARFTGSPAFMERMFGKQRPARRYVFDKTSSIAGTHQEPGAMEVLSRGRIVTLAQNAEAILASPVDASGGRGGDNVVCDRWTGLTKEQLLGPGLAYLERDPTSLAAFLSASGASDVTHSLVDPRQGLHASTVQAEPAATGAMGFQAPTVNYMSKETRTSHIAVPFLDDDGKQVLKHDGTPMMRPSDVDPHFFIEAGRVAIQMDLETSLLGVGPPVQGITGWANLVKFGANGPWDTQRVGSDRTPTAPFIEFSNLAIGIYAAAAGLPEDFLLEIANQYARVRSNFSKTEPMDEAYHFLRKVNVYDIQAGYELVRSRRIRDNTWQMQ